MTINYDPDGVPNPPDDLFVLATRNGMHVVNVICDERSGVQVGEPTGVSFAAMTPFLPHPGDRVQLQDGKVCQVTRSYFRVVTTDGILSLVPNVFAVLCQ